MHLFFLSFMNCILNEWNNNNKGKIIEVSQLVSAKDMVVVVVV